MCVTVGYMGTNNFQPNEVYECFYINTLRDVLYKYRSKSDRKKYTRFIGLQRVVVFLRLSSRIIQNQ